ncbi:MAG TPA: PD-(D/E)XK nuclease family protein [Gammaproteobacteria bacterium]
MNAEQSSPLQSSRKPIHVVSNTGDPVAHLVQLILERHAQQLPDLSQIIVLVPDLQITRYFRQQLSLAASKKGIAALLGPTISTLRAWVESTVPLDRPIMSPQARELMLIEALRQHTHLFGESSPWYLADCLITLFDEMTLHSVCLPGNLDDFIRNLDKGYGLSSAAIPALEREAKLVHTLWRAWHKQQLEEGMMDSHAAYLAKLSACPAALPADKHFYMAGYSTLYPCETVWAQDLMNKGLLTFIIQGDQTVRYSGIVFEPPAVTQKLITSLANPVHVVSSLCDPYSNFLDAAYMPMTHHIYAQDSSADSYDTLDPHGHLAERARQFAASYPQSPAYNRLHIMAAYNAEQEAHAIDIQIRLWLLEGKDRIGIITEDRRLARRLRALLERANILLQDPAGWALSTTSAAATLERWLEILEEDFDHQPLLDFLKSPFILPDEDTDSRLETVYRLEQDIILHENIARGLNRYRQHLKYRRKRLPWSEEDGDRVDALLNTLEHAAQPMQGFIHAQGFLAADILHALTESLQRLCILDTFSIDEAGSRILHELQLMRMALKDRDMRISWGDFRIWLGRTLERTNFSPHQQASKVLLLNTAQSNLHRFDAVIIAGAIDRHLPGPKENNPFFNDTVRNELGIPSSREPIMQRFYHFRHILQCAPAVLITLHRLQNGEPLIPSPWVAIIQAFHDIAYKQSLHDNGLAELSRHPATTIYNTDLRMLPGQKHHPAPTVLPELIPGILSASMHQQWIDCPYQFYVAHCLKLRPPEIIREAMEKSDYGERVHKILQVFHGAGKSFPGAFTQAITAQTRAMAIDKITEISRTEFAHDLEDNVIHRGWLKRWLAVIPAYIDWQIERGDGWHITAVETTLINDQFADNFSIKGRLDRIDRNNNDELGIIDYKTGKPPSRQETESGEAIQLPFYAMLTSQPVQRVEYLKIDKDQVKTEVFIEGQVLRDLQKKVSSRLKTIFSETLNGKPLPAWGDEKTCSLCTMQGICRKQSWI